MHNILKCNVIYLLKKNQTKKNEMLTGYCETTCASVESDIGNFSCMTETFIHRCLIDY